MERGSYIVLEGRDGSGKGTQMALLKNKLAEVGIEFEQVIEPGSGPGGPVIRALVKGASEDPMLQAAISNQQIDLNPYAEALLFSANRAQLMPYIEQKRRAGVWVLADRNYLSTDVYQGYGSGLDLSRLAHLHEFALQGINPDLTLVITVSEAEAQRRRQLRGDTDRFEQRGNDFDAKVREGYRQVVERYNLTEINGDQTEQQVAADIWSHVEPLVLGRK